MHAFNMLTKRMPRMTDEQRIQAAAKLGLKVDPVGTSDMVSVIATLVILGLMAILVILAWINRGYKPIKAKNLLNVTFVYISSIIWIVAVMPGNSIVPVVGIWSACKFWAIWLRMSGIYIFLFLVVFRMHALHRIFVQKRPLRGFGYYWPAIIFVIFLLTFQITSTAVPSKMSVGYTPSLEICFYGKAFHIFLTTTCGVIIAIHTLYIYLTRNIRSSFNEFREGLIIYLVLMADLFVTVFLHIMVKAYPLHKRVRIVSVIVDLLCGCTPVVVLLAHPLYMCYFRHDEYLVKWVGKIREEGMAEVYKLQGITTSMSISAHKNTGKLTSKAAILEDGFGSEQTASSNTCVDRVTAIGECAPQGPFHAGIESTPKNNHNSVNPEHSIASLSTLSI